MVWEKNGTPDTLTVAGDTIEITDQTATKSNFVINHFLMTGGNVTPEMKLNGDTGNNYAFRNSNNGAADATSVNDGAMDMSTTSTTEFSVHNFVNISGREKLQIYFTINQSNAGAGVAPSRSERVGKWANTATQSSQINITNAGVGDFNTDSNLSALGDVVEAPAAVGGWVEIGRTTLGVAGDIIDVLNFSDKRYYMILSDLGRSGLIGLRNRVGTTTIDVGSNYAKRVSEDGGADVTGTNLTFADITLFDNTTSNIFQVAYTANLSANEKLIQADSVGGLVVGAGTAPNRAEGFFKWVNTAAPMQSWRDYHASTGDYTSGSEVVVLGWDPTDTHTDNFWEELASVELTSDTSTLSSGTFTAKKYLWVQVYVAGLGSSTSLIENFNSDTGNNYSNRMQRNGTADATTINRDKLDWEQFNRTTPRFINQFIINNSTEEKLVITRALEGIVAGAGTAPDRVEHVGKWTNTASQITEIIFDDFNSTTTFAGGSFLKVWGAD